MRLELDPLPSSMPFVDDPVPQNVSQTNDSDPDQFLREGIKAAQSGNRAKARAALIRASELRPDSESTWLWLASISEYPEELLVFLTNVLDINPHNQRAIEWTAATRSLLAKTFVQRGIDAAESGQNEAALGYFDQALEHDQQNEMAWLWMASIADSQEGKIAYLEKVISINPSNMEAREAYENAVADVNRSLLEEARSAAVSGNATEANELLDAILAENPRSIEAWELKSHISVEFRDKLDALRHILEIEPENVAARSLFDSLSSIVSSVTAPAAVQKTPPAPTGKLEFPEQHVADLNRMAEASSASPFDSEADPEADDNRAFLEAAVEEAETELTPASAPLDDYVSEKIEIKAAEYVEEVSLRESPAPETSESPAFENGESSIPMPYFEPLPEPAENLTGYETTIFIDDVQEPEFQAGSEDVDSAEPVEEHTVRTEDPELNTAPAEESIVREEQPPTATESTPASLDLLLCTFCSTGNDPQAFVCQGCLAVLTLSDLEMLLANQMADRFLLGKAITKMESSRTETPMSAEDLTKLGIAYLNLRDLEAGHKCLHEALQLDPNNIVLSGQVNALLIRLQEIKKKDEDAEHLPKGKVILVVDDSPTVRKLISGKLEKSGHDVVCSNDGVEAMSKLREIVPDLILLDITMPRMDGYQVCKLIRSNPATKDVPVVMISGKDGFFDKVRGRLAGTSGYITKPFGPETLMKAVETYLKGEQPDD